jgi:hypothetical protein
MGRGCIAFGIKARREFGKRDGIGIEIGSRNREANEPCVH